MRRNRAGRTGAGKAVLLALAVLAALVWSEATLASPLNWLRLHALLCGGVVAVAMAVLTARRRALKRAEFAQSWLAAVPIDAWTARCEALLIETGPAIAAVGLLTVAAISYTLVLSITKSAEVFAPFAVWATLSGGVAVGVLGSFLMPPPKPPDLPPGSRYVPHRKLRAAATVRPSLSALGAWPIRQAFAWAQPKTVSRAVVPILVMMPLGTTADAAMVVIAVCGIFGALVLVWFGVISAGHSMRRWLAPLPVRWNEVTRAILLPTCALVGVAGALEAVLLLAANLSYRTAVEVGACMAVLGCLTLSASFIWTLSRVERR